MKKTWGIITIIILILVVTAGKLYKRYDKNHLLQEQQISQQEVQQIIQDQRQAEIEAQLAEQTRKRDSVYQVEKAAREKQMEDLKNIQKELQKEIDAQNAK